MSDWLMGFLALAIFALALVLPVLAAITLVKLVIMAWTGGC